MDIYTTLLQNQSALKQIYNEQETIKRKKKNKEIKEKKYYGNSAEYKKDWYKNGAQINK